MRPDRELQTEGQDLWLVKNRYMKDTVCLHVRVNFQFTNADSTFLQTESVVNVVTSFFFFLANFAHNQEQQSKNLVMFTPSK